jgi:integrase
MAQATLQITTQAQADNAPEIDGVNLALRPDNTFKPVRIPVADYPGLALQCLPVDKGDTVEFTKSWCFRRGDFFKGLGRAEHVSLADARRAADKIIRELSHGGTVLGKRAEHALKVQDEAKKKGPKTFRECADTFLAGARVRWDTKDGSTEHAWRSRLKNHVFPVIDDLDVAEVTRAHVLEIIEPLWTTKRQTAKRVHQHIREIIDWAICHEYRPESLGNPAEWSKLEKGLANKSAHKVENRPPLHIAREGRPADFAPLHSFLAAIRADESITNLCLEFILLTGVRMSEARFAVWSEFDLDARVWTVPAERIKGKANRRKAHAVPLSDRVLEILAAVKGYASKRHPHVVFPSPAAFTGNEFQGESNLVRNLRRLNSVAHVHGFRSDLRVWAAENGEDPIIAELTLAHAVGNQVERAYQRSTLLEKRAGLLNRWADFCAPKPNRPQLTLVA